MSGGVVLAVDQPLDLPSTLASGQCFRWREDDSGRWTGVIGDDIVRLSRTVDGVAIESSPAPPSEVAQVVASYLRLEDDLWGVQARLGADPRVAEAIAHYPGLRVMRQEPWETLAGFILSSTSNIPRIARTMELLADAFGDERVLDGVTRRTFPAPAAVAEAGETRLRALGCGFRAPYLARAAEAVARGDVPLGRLRGAAYSDVLGALTALHGVGEKIADCAMLFSLDRIEAFPADRWVRRAVSDWYGLASNVSYDAVRTWAWGTFGDDAGYANQYLFWDARQRERASRAGAASPAQRGRA